MHDFLFLFLFPINHFYLNFRFNIRIPSSLIKTTNFYLLQISNNRLIRLRILRLRKIRKRRKIRVNCEEGKEDSVSFTQSRSPEALCRVSLLLMARGTTNSARIGASQWTSRSRSGETTRHGVTRHRWHRTKLTGTKNA